MAREPGVAVLPWAGFNPGEASALFWAVARSARYKQIVTAWFGVFCAGFAVLPGEWEQRWLFYIGIPLALPAVVDAWHRLARGPLFWALTAFLAYSGVSALWSDNWLTIGDELRRVFWLEYFLLICCAVGAQGPAAWRQLFRGVQVFAAFVAVAQVADFSVTCTNCARFTGYGAHANANYTASVTSTFAVLGLAAVLSEPKQRAYWLLACQLPLLALLVATGGRAALLGYAGAIVLAAVLMTLRAGLARSALAVAATVGGLGAVVLVAQSFAGGWLAAEIGRGDTGRMQIWAANVQRILQQPWFGHGSTAVDDYVVDGKVIGFHAHNLFLAQAFYGGVAGLALWLLVFALAARTALRAWLTSRDLLPACGLFLLLAIGMVDIGFVVVSTQAIWFYVWVVLGVVLSYNVADRRSYAAARAPLLRRPAASAS